MQHQSFKAPARDAVLVLAAGEEAIATLTRFAREQEIAGATLTGIGAFEQAVLGYFDPQEQDYLELPVSEQTEVLALTGNIGRFEGAPRIHVHAVLGLRDGTTRGGHLVSGIVRPTLEVGLRIFPAPLPRQTDAASGLALIRFA